MIPFADQTRAKIAEWVQRHRHVVLYDEESSTLLDVASGLSVRFPWSEFEAFEEKVHAETGELYLVFLFESGNQIVHVDPGGVAFSPSAVHTGPLQDLPSVVCLRDFHTLKQRVDHYLYDHREDPVAKECLNLVMSCIAILDGARLVGFDVSELEGELDRSLREIERRTS